MLHQALDYWQMDNQSWSYRLNIILNKTEKPPVGRRGDREVSSWQFEFQSELKGDQSRCIPNSSPITACNFPHHTTDYCHHFSLSEQLL